jgi:hypothetical protein
MKMHIALSSVKQVITTEMYDQARGNKASGIFLISPMDFLKLTCENSLEMNTIIGDAFTLEQYNQFAREGKSIHMPWLEVSIDGLIRHGSTVKKVKPGRVLGHEGRHRAAAMVKAHLPHMTALFWAKERGYTEYKKASKPGGFRDRYMTADDLPKELSGQFNPRVHVPIDLSTFKSLY